QVFQNLIGNAIKFRGERSPRVQVSAEPWAEAGLDRPRWRFAVRDNGIGIEPQYAEPIFVLFQRLHTRSAYPGTGIRLVICKEILEGRGGRIWMESRAGEGTMFFVALPKR